MPSSPSPSSTLALSVLHARTLTSAFTSIEEAALLGRVGEYERTRGDYRVAESLYRTQHGALAELVGDEHRGTLAALCNVAATLSAQGDLKTVRALLEQVLEASPRMLGEEHPDPFGKRKSDVIGRGQPLGDPFLDTVPEADHCRPARMDWELAVPMVAAVIAAVGALLGIVVKHRLERRDPSDKEILERWLQSFNQRAWQEPFDPYTHSGKHDALEVVLKDNKEALRGPRNPSRTDLNEKPSIGALHDQQFAADMQEVARKLDQVRHLAEWLRAPEDPGLIDAKVAELEDLRAEIIGTLNRHAEKRGLTMLPPPRRTPA
jgi:Tetratricopeptide repeat